VASSSCVKGGNPSTYFSSDTCPRARGIGIDGNPWVTKKKKPEGGRTAGRGQKKILAEGHAMPGGGIIWGGKKG